MTPAGTSNELDVQNESRINGNKTHTHTSPLKSQTNWNKSNGRNHNGRSTAWHRGGGHHIRLHREVDLKRHSTQRVIVGGVKYDPNRSV